MTAPALVGLKLKEGVQRHHERELAKKLEMPHQRACLDVAATTLRSSLLWNKCIVKHYGELVPAPA